MFLCEREANAGHFSPRKQTNLRKLRKIFRKKGKFEMLKGFGGLKLTYRLEKSLFQTAKEKSALRH